MSRLRSIRLTQITCLVVGTMSSLAAYGQPDTNPVSSRILGRLHEDGANVPEVRVLFFQEDTGEACVGLGIKEGPNPLRPGFLVFQARTQGDKGKPKRLSFEFDKDKVKTESGLRMWTSCLSEEIEGGGELGPGSEVEVTVRRPRRDTESFVVAFPPPGMAAGIDLWQDDRGRLTRTDRSSSL